MQIQFCIEGDHPLLCCWSRYADPIRSVFCGCVAKNLGGGCAGYLAHPFVENDGFCERMCQVASTPRLSGLNDLGSCWIFLRCQILERAGTGFTSAIACLLLAFNGVGGQRGNVTSF